MEEGPPVLHWETTNPSIMIPTKRNQNLNECSTLSCMQHALIGAIEVRVNMERIKRGLAKYTFSVTNLIYSCGKFLAKLTKDSDRGLPIDYGLIALVAYKAIVIQRGEERICERNIETGIGGLLLLYDWDYTNKEQLFWETCQYIWKVGPVFALLRKFKDFDHFDHESLVYSGQPQPGEVATFHAVLITGYDKEETTFNYLNSWDRSFGRDGIGTIVLEAIVHIYAPLFTWEVPLYDPARVMLPNFNLGPPPPAPPQPPNPLPTPAF